MPSGRPFLRLRAVRLLAAFFLAAGADAAQAGAEPQFAGRWIQGGVLVGRVEPGAQVRYGARELTVDADGRFVIGLAYDAPPAAELRVTAPGGVAQRYEFAVARRDYDVQKIDGLPQGMVQPPVGVQARIEAERRKVESARAFDSPLAAFADTFRWPVPARVTGVYGAARVLNGVPRQPHFGVDLAAPEGAEVHAPADAIVRMAEHDLYYTGGTVILDHGHGLSTTYLHLSRLRVAVGERVPAGAVIGHVGHTGRATGPHLCWRANWFDVRVDPSLLIESEPAQKGESKQ